MRRHDGQAIREARVLDGRSRAVSVNRAREPNRLAIGLSISQMFHCVLEIGGSPPLFYLVLRMSRQNCHKFFFLMGWGHRGRGTPGFSAG